MDFYFILERYRLVGTKYQQEYEYIMDSIGEVLYFRRIKKEGSKRALVHYPANTFPGQTKALADNTHFNTFGAYEISKMVVMGLKEIDSPLTKYLRPGFVDFNPSQPDDAAAFKWVPSKNADLVKPDGN